MATVWKIQNWELYKMFQSMELELWKHLKLGTDVNINNTAKEEIMKNEDVLFYCIGLWCLCPLNQMNC